MLSMLFTSTDVFDLSDIVYVIDVRDVLEAIDVIDVIVASDDIYSYGCYRCH